jgi:hypothetical protein
MAVIKIENLSVVGSELFSDHENYLDELSETDTMSIKGGLLFSILVISTWALV